MRLFTKIFLCTITVVATALSIMGYLMISNSFHNAVARENQRGLEEYQLLKFTLQSGVLSASENGTISDERLKIIAQQTARLAPSGNQTAVFKENKNVIFSDFPAGYSFTIIDDADEQGLTYVIEERGREYWLVIVGKFSQSDMNLFLSTARNITAIVAEKSQMQRNYITTFVIVLCVSSIILFALSLLLTAPIKKLTRNTGRFATGKYNERANAKSMDEIGELSDSFNRMAETIQDTIGQLALNAQQKEDFVANFAHELKTPLTSVIGYADMIYQRDDLTRAEIRNAAGYIINEGMRLEALSQKLMELIVLGRHDFSFIEISMDELFQDVADTLSPIMRKEGITFTVSVQPAYVRIEYDLFKTLLLNLIDNAVKADSKHVTLSGKIDETSYIVQVTDDGRGIAANDLTRITQAFYMVDQSRSRSQHGAGLGLAIASRIAQLHKTMLDYKSEVNKGTIVSISLCMGEKAE